MTSDQPALDDLIRILDLEPVGADTFQGVSPDSPQQRVFGGQVAGQALVAAGRTVDTDRAVHSLHSYFIRPGDPSVPILYTVDRVRDGRSFSTRRVVAEQHGRSIFTLSCSYQLAQPGVEHQPAMPDVPKPEDLPSLEQRYGDDLARVRGMLAQPRPIDVRYVDDPSWDQHTKGPREGLHNVWIRANGVLPDDPLLHVCVLTYASDLTLLDSVLVRHGLNWAHDQVAMASLDHAMWFLQPAKVDDWLLYSMHSPAARGSRGLATGRFFDRAGNHLVSVVQEGMLRVGSR